MDARFGLLFLFVLGTSWVCDATQLEAAPVVIYNASVVQIDPDFGCSLCEEYVTEAIDYISQDETQAWVVEFLQESCSHIPSFEQQCITLVDYYVHLFFMEICSIQPQVLCQIFNLCSKVTFISSQMHLRKDICGACHHAVSEVVTKLEDPDIQLDMLQFLLEGCGFLQNYEKKCESIVFEYGPLVIANTVRFLKATDVCTILHACEGAKHELAADS